MFKISISRTALFLLYLGDTSWLSLLQNSGYTKRGWGWGAGGPGGGGGGGGIETHNFIFLLGGSSKRTPSGLIALLIAFCKVCNSDAGKRKTLLKQRQ